MLPLGLGVHAFQGQLVPHGLHQLVQVPAVLGADGYRVWDAVEEIQLLNTDGVDFVQAVDDGDVTASEGEMMSGATDPSRHAPASGRTETKGLTHLRLFASRTSIISSMVASHLMVMSAELIRYSLMTALISSLSRCVMGTVLVMFKPPLSFFLNVMFGGSLLIRMPKPSSSASMIRLSVRGLFTSSTMQIR